MVKATNRKSNTLAPPLGVIPKPLQMMLLLLPQHARVQLSAQTVSIEPNAKTHELQYINGSVSYTHLRAHETREDLVCRLLLEKKKTEL